MNKEILLLAELVANEKNIAQEDVFQALEEALVGVAQKKVPAGEEADIRVTIDRGTGDYAATHFIYNEDGTIADEQALSIDFGRIAAKSAKQIIIQKLREAEGRSLADSYSERMGELLEGTVKRTVKDGVLIGVDEKTDAFLPNEMQLPQEFFRTGDRVKAVLVDVRSHRSGPQLILSRRDNRMLEALFRIEIPEIEEQVIEIKAIARDPGLRAKVLVKTNDRRIDPIGACIGIRGKRVQVISEELSGERIDIVLWDHNIGDLVVNALSPAEVKEVVVDEDRKIIEVGIAEDNLAKAIGRNGQNVRLVSTLIGWTVNIIEHEKLMHSKNKELEYVVKTFVDALGIDQELAQYLCDAGYTSINNLVHASDKELSKLDLDDEIITELKTRAQNILLDNILSDKEATKLPHKDLLSMDGMNPSIAELLASKDILSKDNLADLSVDELVEIAHISEEEAAHLIMQARESWFAD